MSVWSVKIFVAPWVANFCFGGLENNTIFAMCDTNIVMARIAATGAIENPELYARVATALPPPPRWAMTSRARHIGAWLSNRMRSFLVILHAQFDDLVVGGLAPASSPKSSVIALRSSVSRLPGTMMARWVSP